MPADTPIQPCDKKQFSIADEGMSVLIGHVCVCLFQGTLEKAGETADAIKRCIEKKKHRYIIIYPTSEFGIQHVPRLERMKISFGQRNGVASTNGNQSATITEDQARLTYA